MEIEKCVHLAQRRGPGARHSRNAAPARLEGAYTITSFPHAIARERGRVANLLGDWKVSRDATHQIVELDLGWTRRVVFAVRHGDNTASLAVAHSALGTSVLVRAL